MSLRETTNLMKKILMEIQYDLDKAEGGNKAASQRVRTGSIKFAKVAKMYRKESIGATKKGGKKGVKKSAAKKKKKR